MKLQFWYYPIKIIKHNLVPLISRTNPSLTFCFFCIWVFEIVPHGRCLSTFSCERCCCVPIVSTPLHAKFESDVSPCIYYGQDWLLFAVASNSSSSLLTPVTAGQLLSVAYFPHSGL